MKIFRGAKVYTQGRLRLLDVAVAGDRIAAMGEAGGLQGETEDCAGAYLLPGFIDLHTHGIAGCESSQPTREAYDTMGAAYASHGVTGYLPTLAASYPEEVRPVFDFLAGYLKDRPEGAKVLGVHMEGPFFHPEKRGAQREACCVHPSWEVFQRSVGPHGALVKLMAMAPELPGAQQMAERLLDMGVTLSMGHSTATYEQAKAGADWGMTQATHLFNGMLPIHHRKPGLAGYTLTDPRVKAELICDFIHLHPGAVRLAITAKGVDNCLMVSDSLAAAGMPEGVYETIGQKVIVRGGVGYLEDGVTIAGSTLTLDQGLRNLVDTLGMPVEQVVPMLSTVPARQLKLDHQLGDIRPGFKADLVWMDGQLRVSRTYIDGQLAYQR